MRPNSGIPVSVASFYRLTPLISLVAGLVACQGSVSVPDPTSPQEVSTTLSYSETWKIPDSLTWAIGTDTPQVVTKKTISSTGFTAEFCLPSATKETITLGVWTAGMRFAQALFTLDESYQLKHSRTEYDPIAVALLQEGLTHPPSRRDSLMTRYARHLVDGDATYQGFPGNCPVGFDSASVVRAALVQALNKRTPFGVQSKSWLLKLDSADARAALQKLVEQNAVADSQFIRVFPPNPVRLKTPVSVPVLEMGQTVSISGVFESNTALANLDWKIFQGIDDRSSGFQMRDSNRVNGRQNSWDLHANGRLTLSANGAVAGAYQLKIWMTDTSGYTDTSMTEFQVIGPIDRSGPSVKWIAPTAALELPFSDSFFVIKIKATDPSGIASVTINDSGAILLDSVYRRQLTIPIGSQGLVVTISATDKAGNPTSETVKLFRKTPDPIGAPKVSLRAPEIKTGTILPFDSIYVTARWRIVDQAGIADSNVRISGIRATKEADSTWSAKVAVVPNGLVSVITLEVKNSAGLVTNDFFSVTRLPDTVRPKATQVAGTRTVKFDSATVNVSWLVTDNHKLKNVSIQGQLVTGLQNEFAAQASLNLGVNRIAFIATDSSGNEKTDTAVINRLNDTVKAIVVSDTISRLRSGAFWVKLTCATPGTQIRYSLDGSTPTEQSPLFVDSIKIDTSRVLKTRGFASPRVAGAVATVKYQLAVVVDVSAGDYHTLILMSDGSMWGMGANDNGALGVFTSEWYQTIPVKIADSVLQIAAGGNSSMFVKWDHSLWGIGRNDSGHLGDGTNTRRNRPVFIQNAVAHVSTNSSSSLFRRLDGTLWAMGSNAFGFLGDGTRISHPYPVKIMDSVVQEFTSGIHSLALRSDGSLWTWGPNSEGQLGHQLSAIDLSPRRVLDSVARIGSAKWSVSLVTRTNGELWASGWNDLGQLGTGTVGNLFKFTPIIGGSNVVEATGGITGVLYIDSKGNLFGGGINDKGQFGDGISSSSTSVMTQRLFQTGVTKVGFSSNRTVFVKADGTLWGVGNNYAGPIGEGNWDYSPLHRIRF